MFPLLFSYLCSGKLKVAKNLATSYLLSKYIPKFKYAANIIHIKYRIFKYAAFLLIL